MLGLLKRYRKSGSLLDIGCAYGFLVDFANKGGFKAEGFDISEFAISKARNYFPCYKFYVAALGKFKPGKKYDMITCIDVIEHVKDVNKSIRYIKSIMKSDGLVMFKLPVRGSFFQNLLLNGDKTHIYKYSKEKWINILSKHFKIIDIHSSNLGLFFDVPYFFEEGIILICQKK